MALSRGGLCAVADNAHTHMVYLKLAIVVVDECVGAMCACNVNDLSVSCVRSVFIIIVEIK
jgi:hypothetical protein